MDQETTKTSGTVTWNQDSAGVDQAVVYLFRVGPKDAKNVLARLKERLGKKSGIKGILI